MKRVIKSLFAVSVILGCSVQVRAWSGRTHSALTEKAIFNNIQSVLDNYLKEQLNVGQGLGAVLLLDELITPDAVRVLPEIPTNPSVLDLLKAGSRLEDIPLPRARHHFHDSYRNIGLENRSEHPARAATINFLTDFWYDLSFDLTGASALERASGTEDPNWEVEYQNYFAWPDTRDYFKKALTEPNSAAREHYLALTFLSMGHTVHLLEDMGVPPHARNDFIEAHFRAPMGLWENPLEEHVEDEIKTLGTIPASWLEGWTPQTKVFNKLAHYWDTNDYNGVYVGDTPLSNWGLSEQTNYQFLSKSTIFRENVIIDPNTGARTRYYFPHPDVNHTTEHIDTEVYLWGLVPVDYKYISGYDITHLARTKFIQKYAYMAGMPYPIETVAYHTTFDEAVYEDYAETTIPRTIDYATGLMNYFFRGRLSVEPNWTDPNIVEFIITNDSNNSGVLQTLKGGSFELYWDDTNDTRTQIDPNNITFIPGWAPDSTLPNDGGVTGLIAQFALPAENVKRYFVVYKGSISENPLDPDLDDPNALAVGTVAFGYEIVAWTDDPARGDKYGQISNVPDGSDFIAVAAGKYHCLALKSDGLLAAWGYNNHGECNVPDGTDFTAIAAGTYHSMALKSDGTIVVWGGDNLGQISDKPTGSDFVAITAGDWHSLGLKSDGTIVGWGGWNSYGECDAPAPDIGTFYTAIAAGTYHSLALQSDGTVKAWGNNNNGQTQIYVGAAGNVHVAMAASANYSLLLRDDEVLIAWGGGDWLEPGIPRYHYRQADGNDFVAIAAGTDHIMALTSDGKVFDWEWPNGDFPFDYFSIPVPDEIVFTDSVAAGYKFSLSLKVPQ